MWHTGSQFPDQRSNPGSLHWEHKVLTTGSPKSEIAQLCQTLCDPIDWSLPGSSIHEIFQARVLEWVAISFSNWTTSLVQFSSVAQSCQTVCDPMNRSTPGLPVHHQLPEFTQTHVRRVSDAIQPSHPLSSPSPPAPMDIIQYINRLQGIDILCKGLNQG